MTTLAIWFSILLVLALALLLWPLLKQNTENALHPKVIWGIVLFVPSFTMSLYFILGTPQFANIAKSQVAPEVVTLVDKLEQRLQQDPNDLTGWLLLGRSYMVEENYPKAITAYEQALRLDRKNLKVLLPLADALAIQADGKLTGRPYQLLQTAYQVDATNTMTLWLLGMAEKQQNHPQKATQHWLALYDLLPEDHPDKTTVLGLLASVGYIPGLHQFETLPPRSTESNQEKNAEKPEISQKNRQKNTATFVLTIAENLKHRYPNASVFLYAKQVNGSPMPLAAKQIPLAQLPAGKNIFALNKKDFIQQNQSFNNFKQLILGYRLMSAHSINSQTLRQAEQTTGPTFTVKFELNPTP